MTKYAKQIGGKTIKMEFAIPESILIEKGWVKLAEIEEEPSQDDPEEMEEEPTHPL